MQLTLSGLMLKALSKANAADPKWANVEGLE